MIHLKDIDKLINKSININREMLNILAQSNKVIEQSEKRFLNILLEQNIDTFIKTLANDVVQNNNIDLFSDLIHLFEFKIFSIKGFKGRILDILNERRRMKMLVGYCNRVQQERGFTNSIYWYNRQYSTSINSYSLKTNINDIYKKDVRISKKD